MLGDLLGVLSVTPAVLLALTRAYRPPQASRRDQVGERLLWSIAPLTRFLLMAGGIRGTGPEALGVSALARAVMLWSALRFSRLRTALSVVLTVLLLGSFA